MQYINLEGDLIHDLQISISGDATAKGIAVPLVHYPDHPEPLKDRRATNYNSQVCNVLSELEVERSTKEAGTPIECMIAPLDPWLQTVAQVMIEGIIQGVTWDVCRAAIDQALGFLRGRGLAPRTPEERESRTETQFHWAGYVGLGELNQLFSRMEYHYRRNTEKRLTQHEQSTPPPPPPAESTPRLAHAPKRAAKKKAAKKTPPKKKPATKKKAAPKKKTTNKKPLKKPQKKKRGGQ